MYLWHHWTMALRRSTLIDIGVYMLVIVVVYLYGHEYMWFHWSWS